MSSLQDKQARTSEKNCKDQLRNAKINTIQSIQMDDNMNKQSYGHAKLKD